MPFLKSIAVPTAVVGAICGILAIAAPANSQGFIDSYTETLEQGLDELLWGNSWSDADHERAQWRCINRGGSYVRVTRQCEF